MVKQLGKLMITFLIIVNLGIFCSYADTYNERIVEPGDFVIWRLYAATHKNLDFPNDSMVESEYNYLKRHFVVQDVKYITTMDKMVNIVMVMWKPIHQKVAY